MAIAGAARRICLGHGATLDEVLSASRHPRIVRARHRLWMILRDTLDLSYPELGALFDRDHTTIMSGVKKCRARLEKEHAV